MSSLPGLKKQLTLKRNVTPLVSGKADKSDKKKSNKDVSNAVNRLKKSVRKQKLLHACESGDDDTVAAILKSKRGRKMNLEFTDVKGRSPLIYASANGHVGVVKELLIHGVNVEHKGDGSTPLYWAASRAFFDVVRQLLIAGADPNALNQKGWTPLMNASYFGNLNVVALLLQYGADIDLFRHDDRRSSLHWASRNGRTDVVELLLKYGANPNIEDSKGCTPLIYAVQNEHEHITQLLLLNAADPCQTDLSGHCALDYCEGKGNKLSTFMQQSSRLHTSICKLVQPDGMRKTVKLLKQVQHNFPIVKEKLSKVSRMHDLGKLEHTINQFCEVQCNGTISATNQLKTEMDVSQSPSDPNASHMYQDDSNDDRSDNHLSVLRAYRNDMKNLRMNRDTITKAIKNSRESLQKAVDTVKECNRDEIDIAEQIAKLRKQLTRVKDKKEQNQQYQRDTAIAIENMKSSLAQVGQELKAKDRIFQLLEQASAKIKDHIRQATTDPLRYRRELQSKYKEKRSILERDWTKWQIDDVITWICSLEPNGRFFKYEKSLQKLKEFESDDKVDSTRLCLSSSANHDRPISSVVGNESLSSHIDDLSCRDTDTSSKEGDAGDHGSSSDEYGMERKRGSDSHTTDGGLSDSSELESVSSQSDNDEGNTPVIAPAEPSNNAKRRIQKLFHQKNKQQSSAAQFSSFHASSEGVKELASDRSPELEVDIQVSVSRSPPHKIKEGRNRHRNTDDDADKSKSDQSSAEAMFSDERDNIDAALDDLLESLDDDLLESPLKMRDGESNIVASSAKPFMSAPFVAAPFHKSMEPNQSSKHRSNRPNKNRAHRLDSKKKRQSEVIPDEPVLENINQTVLKMCGIRDAKDRKFIMYNIELLISTVPKLQPSDSTPMVDDSTAVDISPSPHIPVRDSTPVSIGNESEEKCEPTLSNEIVSDGMGPTEIRIPDEFICPITKSIMENPVICSDGHCYEREAIEDWLIKRDTSPMTNEKLMTKQLFPSHGLRSMIQDFKTRNQSFFVRMESQQTVDKDTK